MAELIVRKAERGDAEAVAKLEQICCAVVRGGFNPRYDGK